MSTLWNNVPLPVFTQTGQPARGAKAYFYLSGTTTPLVVYTDSALTAPQPIPVVADYNGVFPNIYLPYGDYKRTITQANGVLISTADGISNPAPPSGGTGIVVTTPQILQTGDPIWRLRVGTMDGFVRMNANTIGSATSAATERANADCEDLFNFLWNNLSDTVAPVIGGRGSSASLDWFANKAITVPSMQGRMALGLDDMGSGPADIIQAETTCTADGSAVVIVADATGLVVGMNAIVNAIANGVIEAIAGTSVTLSSVVTAGTALTFRASAFADATVVGNIGGVSEIIQTVDQVGPHAHTAISTDGGHHHNTTLPLTGNSLGSGGGQSPANGPQSYVSDPGFAIITTTVAASPAANPMLTLSPARLGTWFLKL